MNNNWTLRVYDDQGKVIYIESFFASTDVTADKAALIMLVFG